ncbi:uncharacterized protein FA14DRAFT_24684 [Meira miltonrushii]|uniref:Golgi apparatus membrane protein TVP38 n=1 Tax=Meira miltonrushii TaxID=1280837 RepID=A0A316VL35_9BASI|nr:uncharacterized protein FA14DRAFT_24684 [Meira miltonrushii]PWN38266.1 hypothetical protein FA14DRAFT_24684 [Meira miltonrushii]
MPLSRQSSLKGNQPIASPTSSSFNTSSTSSQAGKAPIRTTSGTTTGVSISPNISSPTTINGKGAANSFDLAAPSPNPHGGVIGAGGRNTPQSASVFANSGNFIVNRPGSASAINRRRSEHIASPIDQHSSHQWPSNSPTYGQNQHVHHPQSATISHYHPYQNVFEEEGITFEDDEQDKGHGASRRASASFAANNSGGRWTPTILSNMLRKAEGRFSPVSTFTNHNAAASTASSSHKSAQPISPRFKMVTSEPEEMAQEDEEVAYDTNDQPALGGRKTPARYRPQTESGPKLGLVIEQPSQEASNVVMNTVSGSGYGGRSASRNHSKANGAYTPSSPATRQMHPLSHAHKMSTASSTSASSHSIKMQSPQMMSHSRHASLHKNPLQSSPNIGPSSGSGANASPLIVPQARRGAINLRHANRRGKSGGGGKRRNRVTSHSVPIHIQVVRILKLVFWALLHPLGACKSFSSFITTTMHDIDKAFRDPRTGNRVWRPAWLGAYVPLLIWLAVSLSSTFTVLVWHTEVFQGLDRLSLYLQSLGLTGRLILGFLIFITTFPPLPLYSTLIILCGFSFGLIQGFIISYIAALSGAIVVFVMSRSFLKGWMVGLLNQSGGLKKVVRAIEKRPKLLFLVRLAPYPYNLMNTLLASSPTLTLKTYTMCTALALPKLLVHCGLGTTIKNFAAYNGAASSPGTNAKGEPLIGDDHANTDQAKASETAELIKHIFGLVGVVLCVGIFLYLFSVARKAVDEELDEDELAADEYELMATDEESADGLEEDELNIANAGFDSSRNVSSDGSREDVSGSQRNSSQSFVRSNGVQFAGRNSNSDATLVNGGGMLNVMKHKAHESTEGATPLFIAPSSNVDGGVHGDGSGNTAKDGGFFGAWGYTPSSRPMTASQSNNSVGNTFVSKRYMDSQTSLVESIAEMEKHANAMSDFEGDHDIYGTANDQRHDISIEFSPPPIKTKHVNTVAQQSVIGNDDELDGERERQSLLNVDRERASRRSQMGYEEDHFGGVQGHEVDDSRAITPRTTSKASVN